MDVPTRELSLREPLVGLLLAYPGIEIADGVFGGGGYMAEAADMLPCLSKWRQEECAEALLQLEQLIDQARGHADCVEIMHTEFLGTAWPDATNCESDLRNWLREIWRGLVLAGKLQQIEQGWLGWHHGCVRQLIAGIEAEVAFDRLAILADALEDAGCGDELLLNHCRHGHGASTTCWVVEVIRWSQQDAEPVAAPNGTSLSPESTS